MYGLRADAKQEKKQLRKRMKAEAERKEIE